MAKTIKLGLFGLGTVGAGLVNIIERRKAELLDQAGIDLQISRVLVRNPSRKRACPTDGLRLTTRPEDLFQDDSIDLFVELIGGTEDARRIVETGLQKGKAVVTANKALIATSGPELMSLARLKNVPFFAEASVGGGIPILKALRESLVANEIMAISAIINGTTNFILTQMEEEGLSYYEALKLAGEKGFAEADPTLDVEGIDAQQKLLIMAAHICGGVFPQGKILCEGITQLSDSDFRFAHKHGMTIKLLALARRRGTDLELRVHPTLISQKHPLASVRNEFNAVLLHGDAVGEVMLAGRGAGGMPTASAVYADIVDICTRTTILGQPESAIQPLRILEPEKIESEYYLCFTVEDKPGVIGDVTAILGRHDISVRSVGAELIPNVPELGLLEIILHKSSEAQVRKAVDEINRLPRIIGDGKFIRIER